MRPGVPRAPVPGAAVTRDSASRRGRAAPGPHDEKLPTIAAGAQRQAEHAAGRAGAHLAPRRVAAGGPTRRVVAPGVQSQPRVEAWTSPGHTGAAQLYHVYVLPSS